MSRTCPGGSGLLPTKSVEPGRRCPVELLAFFRKRCRRVVEDGGRVGCPRHRRRRSLSPGRLVSMAKPGLGGSGEGEKRQRRSACSTRPRHPESSILLYWLACHPGWPSNGVFRMTGDDGTRPDRNRWSIAAYRMLICASRHPNPSCGSRHEARHSSSFVDEWAGGFQEAPAVLLPQGGCRDGQDAPVIALRMSRPSPCFSIAPPPAPGTLRRRSKPRLRLLDARRHGRAAGEAGQLVDDHAESCSPRRPHLPEGGGRGRTACGVPRKVSSS
jgi:hypothetical protein